MRGGVRVAVPGIVAGGMLVLAAASAATGEPVRVSVSTFPAPLVPGPAEIRVLVEAARESWHGDVAVGGTTSALRIVLDVQPHGRRLVVLPWTVAPTDSAIVVSVDGVPAARVDVNRAGDVRRLLTLADERSPREPGRPVARVADLPETPRAYASLDLVVLPARAHEHLAPRQEAAIDRWLRWGGAIGTPSAVEAPALRRIGAGAAIAAPTADAIERAHARWRADAPPPSWRGSAEPSDRGAARTPRQDGVARVGVAVAAYVGSLALAGLVLAGIPGARGAGVSVALGLAVLGSVAVWAVARAGASVSVDVEETSVVRALGDGREVEVTARIHASALRSGVTAFGVPLDHAAVQETAVAGASLDHRRALRLDVRTGQDAAIGTRFDRTWAVGERAAFRVEGTGAPLAVRAARLATGDWDVDNRSRHTLRSVIVATADGTQRLGDLAAGARVLVRRPMAGEGADEVPALVKAGVESRRGAPVLVAQLEPPLATVEFPSADVSVRRTSTLVVLLDDDRPRGPRP